MAREDLAPAYEALPEAHALQLMDVMDQLQDENEALRYQMRAVANEGGPESAQQDQTRQCDGVDGIQQEAAHTDSEKKQ